MRKSKEEYQKMIEEEVQKRLAEERKKDSIESKKAYVEETLRNGVYKHKYERLNLKYLMDLAKYLINDDDFNESERDILRYNFADDLVYLGTSGFGSDKQEIINNFRLGIISKLRE